MAKEEKPETVRVAVALIRHYSEILAVYNESWGAYTLPMTKLRRWENPDKPDSERWEDARHAAGRAAAEWLNMPCVIGKEVERIQHFGQSDRSGEWKHYDLQVYQIALNTEENRDLRSKLVAGTRSVWLAPSDLMKRQPISPTAVVILEHVRGRLFPTDKPN